MRGKNRCYVCFRKHDKAFEFKFPKDIPYKFRWCCHCLRNAKRTLSISELEGSIRFYKENYKRMARISLIRRAKLLYKLINLA